MEKLQEKRQNEFDFRKNFVFYPIEFQDYYELLVDHAMLDVTKVNPVEMPRKEMEKDKIMAYYI